MNFLTQTGLDNLEFASFIQIKKERLSEYQLNSERNFADVPTRCSSLHIRATRASSRNVDKVSFRIKLVFREPFFLNLSP